MEAKNPGKLTEDELAVYEFALRDEFNGVVGYVSHLIRIL